MNNKQIDSVLKILKKESKKWDVPVAELVQLQTGDPFRILITTILSARTKDTTTAKVVKKLFAEVKSFDDLEKISTKKLEKLIYPVGFYRTKAKHLKQLPSVLKEKFNGSIPHDIGELVQLPGVGRKTANLVRNLAFGKMSITVDVHVERIVNRLGYVKTKSPLETEMILRGKLPKKWWRSISYLLVAFGQNLCKPRKPECWRCPISKHCKYYQKKYLPSLKK